MASLALPLRAAFVLGVLAIGWPVAGRAQSAPPVARYAAALGSEHPRIAPQRRSALAERVTLISAYYRIDPALLMALVSVESGWRPNATSPVGALGLGQLMPQTAAALDVLPLRTDENLDGTARYLRRMLDRFGASERLALAAYNAGPGAVARFRGVPPFRETQAYVVAVMRVRDRLAALAARIGEHGAPGPPPATVARLRPAVHPARVRPPGARRLSKTALAYLAAPDPNGVALGDVPPPEPSAIPARATVAASTSVWKRVFGRKEHPGS